MEHIVYCNTTYFYFYLSLSFYLPVLVSDFALL